MNKFFFRLLVVLMSLSLLGIILVQVYWFKTSFENNEEQFKFHVKQVLGNVSENLQKQEEYTFYNKYYKLKSKTGKMPETSDLLEYGYFRRNSKTNETIIYSSTIVAEDYDIFSTFFDKNANSNEKIKSFSAKRKTEVFSKNPTDKLGIDNGLKPDLTISKEGSLKILEDAQFEIAYKDVSSLLPIQDRVTKEQIEKVLASELDKYGIKTPYEYNIYSNGLATKIKSDSFKYDKYATYSIPVFVDNEGASDYQLLVTFPQKKKFLFKDVVGISLLSVIFTLIIIIAYANALNQLFKQKQISEIKTDFINNMTHEFKTPIATINLALDAIKNPKVIDDKEKVFRYLQMIRDENKRMHAQVENVLRISKLEKKELEIEKEPQSVHDIIEVAIDHISLIVEDKGGSISTQLLATRDTALVNDVHFTNVLVNILDNAVKYSPEAPVINVITENIKDYLVIKIADKGAGMSKQVQKKIFEKFYREHTGDVHNVKGHGLGLAYVKTIIDDHNGQIYVESEKGKGSVFTIKLPLIN
ncbi:two-component system phosphate regulon sensor histidine kinase PhoR [Flavobacterium croceum DSM 17960]|uniref:histidine kinase n=1 Tax=Flavobacterium croceum DSM 17960 TaxID=1121886 RepID=A0A2S4NBN3_9FLAO|nr:HAMP domain-containing sensor histidine kinase [Flavobacterium croceum]POS02863.1 two-component system phosphate regulon sensor histidine kinase PhoR [Flavobacterium croceum DSM 17960]